MRNFEKLEVWKKAHSKGGFTLIEFVIVILLTGIIAGILSILIREVFSTYSFIRVRGIVLSDNRLAMDRMTREIRQIKSADNIYTADSTEIRFYKMGDEFVEFYLSGSELKRRDGSDDILANNVTLFDLVYYDTGNVILDRPVLDPSTIWRILIKITIKKGDETVKFQSQVHPRNL